MPKIIVDQPFKFAHHGYQVEEFAAGELPVETTDECAQLAVAEKWARLVDEATGEAPAPVEPPPPAQAELDPKAAEAAPENRDAAAQRSTKARG